MEKLGTIQDTETHHTQLTQTMTANKNLATDPTTDTLTTNYCYTTTAIVFTDNDTTIGSFVPCTTDQECYNHTPKHEMLCL